MAKFKVIVPFIDDMGSMSPFIVNDDMGYETKEDYALWEINKTRDHDMLEHLAELPDGIKFELMGCDNNNLTSLELYPQYISGDFDFSNIKLPNLDPIEPS